ncbi:hypothetical protein BZG36_04316 [Bifiguratus adelaidae]|uniref:Uncharacterized protein n=1 Tax=Bifiguratus adelaidae TaxID=1938954 RepID=A0A261XZP6_9FUNG|nr:hypothetical protein BZG36_04316 [Bifiguratus adelaidae]
MITAALWTVIHQSIKRQRQEERRQQQQQSKTVSVKGVLAPDIFSTVWKVAAKALNADEPPTEFPYFTAPGTNTYVYEPASHWTSGFFAGTLWALYERVLKDREGVESPITKEQLLEAARKWESGLVQQQGNTEMHNLGLVMMPAFRRDHALTGSQEALDAIVQTAESLATRYNDKVKAIRSRNDEVCAKYGFDDQEYFLVDIDSMMNLELLYYAAEKTGNKKFADIATNHAETVLGQHIRPDFSTFHLVIYNAQTGGIKRKMTFQGYTDQSTWSRGEAFVLYGFAIAYKYTKDQRFLAVSKKAADYFVMQTEDDGTVYWDFDIQRPTHWDVSAAMIAGSGMLLLQQLEPAIKFLGCVALLLNRAMNSSSKEGDTILEHSTLNNHALAGKTKRITDVGVVYADYYFIEIGNRLLDMGF